MSLVNNKIILITLDMLVLKPAKLENVMDYVSDYFKDKFCIKLTRRELITLICYFAKYDKNVLRYFGFRENPKMIHTVARIMNIASVSIDLMKAKHVYSSFALDNHLWRHGKIKYDQNYKEYVYDHIIKLDVEMGSKSYYWDDNRKYTFPKDIIIVIKTY